MTTLPNPQVLDGDITDADVSAATNAPSVVSSPSQPPPLLSSVAELGDRYVLCEKIGEGGMGVVYRARDKVLQRDVALKLLPDAYAKRDALRERLTREARAAARVASPSVAAVYDLGVFEGRLCLAMELVEGETLRKVLSRGSLPAAQIEAWVASLAEGLATAHARGVVHRDLKPDNIMVTPAGALKILDFGLARSEANALGDDPQAAPLTRAGAVVGTPAYMSPEQARGEPADARSDVFSFGLILREMLGGGGPSERASAGSGATVDAARPATALRRRPSVLATYRSILARCLAAEPSARFQDAGEIVQALGARRSPSWTLRAPVAGLVFGAAVLVATGAAFVRARGPASRQALAGAVSAEPPPRAPATAMASATAAMAGGFSHIDQLFLIDRLGKGGWVVNGAVRTDQPGQQVRSLYFSILRPGFVGTIQVYTFPSEAEAERSRHYLVDTADDRPVQLKYAASRRGTAVLSVGNLPLAMSHALLAEIADP